MLDVEIGLWNLPLLASDPTFANKLDQRPVALVPLLKTSLLYWLWHWLLVGKLHQTAFLLGTGCLRQGHRSLVWCFAPFALPVRFWKELKSRIPLKEYFNLKAQLLQTFFQRDGETVYLLYRVVTREPH